MAKERYSVAIPITPAANSAASYNPPYAAIYIGKAGNVRIRTSNLTNPNTEVIFCSVPAGTRLEVKTMLVCTANTTAGNIIGLI